MMSVFDHVGFTEVGRATDSKLNIDLLVCLTEPYKDSLAETGSRNKLLGRDVSEIKAAMDFSNGVKTFQSRIPKILCDIKQKQLDENFFSDFSPTERIFFGTFQYF